MTSNLNRTLESDDSSEIFQNHHLVDNFKDLRIIFFRDTQSYGKQKIQFFNGKNLISEYNFENNEELIIPKSDIQKLFSKTEINLTIKYFDEKEPKGILLGFLVLEN